MPHGMWCGPSSSAARCLAQRRSAKDLENLHPHADGIRSTHHDPAGLTLLENDHDGPRIVPYRKLPPKMAFAGTSGQQGQASLELRQGEGNALVPGWPRSGAGKAADGHPWKYALGSSIHQMAFRGPPCPLGPIRERASTLPQTHRTGHDWSIVRSGKPDPLFATRPCGSARGARGQTKEAPRREPQFQREDTCHEAQTSLDLLLRWVKSPIISNYDKLSPVA
jgi:hypothetical protein